MAKSWINNWDPHCIWTNLKSWRKWISVISSTPGNGILSIVDLKTIFEEEIFRAKNRFPLIRFQLRLTCGYKRFPLPLTQRSINSQEEIRAAKRYEYWIQAVISSSTILDLCYSLVLDSHFILISSGPKEESSHNGSSTLKPRLVELRFQMQLSCLLDHLESRW